MAQVADSTQEAAQTAETKPKKATESFFATLNGYSAPEWERQLLLRLYRTAPQIDMGLKGAKEFYIERYTEPIDEGRVKQDQGSGGYLARLYRSLPGKKDQLIDELYFSIFDAAFPPKAPRGIWTSAPANAKWAEAFPDKPPETSAGAGPNGSVRTGMNASEVLQIVDKVLEKVKPATPEQADALQSALVAALQKGHEKSIEMILKQVDAQSPDKMVAMITALQGLIKAEQPTVQDPLVMVSKVMDGLGGLVKLLKPEKPEVSTETRRESKFFDVFLEKAAERMFGEDAGVSHGGGGKYEFWRDMVHQAPVIMGGLQGIIMHGIAAWKLPAGEYKEMLQRPGGAGSVPRETPEAVAKPAGSLTEPSPTPPNMQRLMEIGGLMAAAFGRGEAGGEVAASVSTMFGADVYNQVRAMGPEMILGAFKQSPLWPQLAPFESGFAEFVKDFVSQDDEAEEPPPVLAAGGRKRK